MAQNRMPSGDYKKILIRVPYDLLEKLEAEAKKQHRSVNGQLVHTLEQSLTSDNDPAYPRREAVSA